MENLAENVLPWVYALGLHLGVLALLSLSFSFSRPQTLPPPALAIKATVVDEALVRQELDRLEQADTRREREQQAERDRLKREAEQAQVAREKEQQRLAKLEVERKTAEETARVQAQRTREDEQRRLAEQESVRKAQAEEQARLARLEEQRKAEEARLAKLAREREEQEQRQRDEQKRLAAVAKEREDEERRRREAEAARERARLEQELSAAIQVEENRRHAEQSGLLAQYTTLIRQKVERNWSRPPGAGAGLACDVRVRQIPGGEVVDVRIVRCNGDAAVERSIEAAVYKASPLPPPPDPSLFERDLVFEFRPE